jgi:hypothetical protein
VSVTVQTSAAQPLLAAIKTAISERKVETWISTEGGDFTHSVSQWKNKAWFRPRLSSVGLTFSIIRPQDGKISTEAYAIYHGRFIEMLLAHFDKLFRSAAASALPSSGDLV